VLRKCGEDLIKKVGEKFVNAGEQMKNVGQDLQHKKLEKDV